MNCVLNSRFFWYILICICRFLSVATVEPCTGFSCKSGIHLNELWLNCTHRWCSVSRGAMPKTNAFQFRKVCSSTVPPNSQLHRNICMLHASDARILSHSYTGYTGYTTVSHRRSWVLTACSARPGGGLVPVTVGCLGTMLGQSDLTGWYPMIWMI